jgi:hypothetical protein
MEEQQPLVDQKYLLEKFPGKGGWTYAAIPEVMSNKNKPFGWVKVKGSIDHYQFKNFTLMPMGNGRLFLPVKAEIRRQIGKKEGDWVRIVLFTDEAPLDTPEELLECFALEPAMALENFRKLKDSERKAYLEWIYGAKKEDTKAERIAAMMDRLTQQANVQITGKQ